MPGRAAIVALTSISTTLVAGPLNTELNQVPTVGTGPFLPVKWDKGAQYQMKRNDTYFRGKANLDSYIYKVVPDGVQIANQLRTGEIDVGSPDKSQWDSLATADNINRVVYAGPSFDYYIQNLDSTKTPKPPSSATGGAQDLAHGARPKEDRRELLELRPWMKDVFVTDGK